jgi:hypothetical protein
MDNFGVVLETFLDDAICRVAAKENQLQLSHCSKRKRKRHCTQRHSAHSHREHNKHKLKLQDARDKSTFRYCSGCLS